MFNIFGRIIVITFLILSFNNGMVAQSNSVLNPKNNSSFSRLGLGDFTAPYYAAQSSMGGVGVANVELFHMNPLNPASLAHLKNTSFEGALNARISNWQDAANQNNSLWTGNIQYLSLAFPLQSPINQAVENIQTDFNWGMGLSLHPYTVVGYNIEINDDTGEFGPYSNVLKGNGGTYKLNWANGWRYKDLSVGLNIAYLFGKITNSRRVSLDDLSQYAWSTELLDEYNVSGFQFKGGVQYTMNLQDEVRLSASNRSVKRLIFGATASLASNFNNRVKQLYFRENLGINLISIDTIVSVDDQILKGRLPAEYAFGISYEKTNNFRMSLDYSLGNWSDYQNEAKPDELLNNSRLAFGLEWIPDITSYNRYYERIRYHFGAFTGSDPRTFNEVQLDNTGLTFGISMPVERPRQAISFLHLAVELGQMKAGDLLRENYAQFTFGFSLNDNTWFYKRKFN